VAFGGWRGRAGRPAPGAEALQRTHERAAGRRCIALREAYAQRRRVVVDPHLRRDFLDARRQRAVVVRLFGVWGGLAAQRRRRAALADLWVRAAGRRLGGAVLRGWLGCVAARSREACAAACFVDAVAATCPDGHVLRWGLAPRRLLCSSCGLPVITREDHHLTCAERNLRACVPCDRQALASPGLPAGPGLP
jgi:hypothetical protein